MSKREILIFTALACGWDEKLFIEWMVGESQLSPHSRNTRGEIPGRYTGATGVFQFTSIACEDIGVDFPSFVRFSINENIPEMERFQMQCALMFLRYRKVSSAWCPIVRALSHLSPRAASLAAARAGSSRYYWFGDNSRQHLLTKSEAQSNAYPGELASDVCKRWRTSFPYLVKMPVLPETVSNSPLVSSEPPRPFSILNREGMGNIEKAFLDYASVFPLGVFNNEETSELRHYAAIAEALTSTFNKWKGQIITHPNSNLATMSAPRVVSPSPSVPTMNSPKDIKVIIQQEVASKVSSGIAYGEKLAYGLLGKLPLSTETKQSIVSTGGQLLKRELATRTGISAFDPSHEERSVADASSSRQGISPSPAAPTSYPREPPLQSSPSSTTTAANLDEELNSIPRPTIFV